MKKIVLMLSFCLPVFGFTQTWSDQNSSITNDLEDVYFADNNNGWAVGRQGKIIHTANGGVTWAEENSGTTKDLNKVFMTGPTMGYAVGDGGTVIKYNGSTWSALNISFSQDMYGVYFLDDSNGWVSGDWGCIKKTSDGGATWTTQMSNSVYSNTFNDLHMLSSTEGWAVGSSGKVLKYNGTSWNSVSNPASADLNDLYAVSFSSSGNGFMTGKNSTVYKWDGSSWTTQNTALTNNSFHVYDVNVISDNLAYAVTTPGFGGGGVILKYNGTTWTKDYEYTGMNSELFSGLASTPNGNLYAVAATGMIKAKVSGNPATGISSATKELGLTAYPNPFSSSFTLELPTTENDVILTVKDLHGKVLKTISDNVSGSGTLSVNGSDLAPGLYFYTLTTAGSSVTGKIIKE